MMRKQIKNKNKEYQLEGFEKRYFPYFESKLNVCVYCRYDPNKKYGIFSLDSLKQYYKEMIKKHPQWVLKKIFADKNKIKSGENRVQFIKMVEDCKNGKYDLIITKDICTFAKPIVERSMVIKQLKNQSHPVGIYFEIEKLFTLSEDAELLLQFESTMIAEQEEQKKNIKLWTSCVSKIRQDNGIADESKIKSEQMKRSFEQRYVTKSVQ